MCVWTVGMSGPLASQLLPSQTAQFIDEKHRLLTSNQQYFTSHCCNDEKAALYELDCVAMSSQAVTHFAAVDHTSDPDFFLRFIDEANQQPAALAWKPELLRGLTLAPGMKVLDVGCGTGGDACEMAALVVPGGAVTGVDFSEFLINEAKRRAAGRDLPLTFEVGDAQALPYPSGSFDAVRTERMLMHVPDVAKAVGEMARVLKPGGRMAVHDFDWETQFCDSRYKEITRKIMLSFCDGMKNGWIGRSLPRLFREAGLADISVSFYTVKISYGFLQFLLGGHVVRLVAEGVLTEQEANRWWTDLSQANAEGRFLYGNTAVVATGSKPAGSN